MRLFAAASDFGQEQGGFAKASAARENSVTFAAGSRAGACIVPAMLANEGTRGT